MATMKRSDRRVATIRVLQFTDTHLAGGQDPLVWGMDTLGSLHQVLDQARRSHWPPSVILASGDLAHDPTPDAYRRLCNAFSGVKAPVLCLPGNHDNPSVMAETLSTTPLECMRDLQIGAWQILLLDSTVPGSIGGHLDRTSLDRLEERLAAEPDQHALICLHHPPVPVGSDWMDRTGLDNPEALLATIDRHTTVRCVIWGHIHQEFSSERKGVRLLGSPSTCVQFSPGSEEFSRDHERPPGYRWLNLGADGSVETGVAFVEAHPAETL
jgi:Icc protein